MNCAVGCVPCMWLLGEKKNIYEHKHLYNKIPLECEARQCYDADYDDSLSPLTFSGEWSEDSCLKKKKKSNNNALAPPSPPFNTVDFLLCVLPPCLDSCTFQRLQLHYGSARSCPLGVIIAQVVTWKTVKVGFVILYEGVFEPPRAVCLWIHLSAPNQILLDRCLSPFRPTDILHSVCLQGVQDKVKGLRFFNLILFFLPEPPTTPDPPHPPPDPSTAPTHFHLTQDRTSLAPHHPSKVSP